MAPPVYNANVEKLRPIEYPHMENGTYLDHSGTTIYPKSAINSFAAKLTASSNGDSLFGNPHSANAPAKRSGDVVDSVRLRTLQFLGADPAHFDLIFVANATAGIKLVAEAFRDLGERTEGGGDDDECEGEERGGSFWYGYHKDSHTSLVGVRELTAGEGWYTCFGSDEEVDRWIATSPSPFSPARQRGSRPRLGLLAYPGQSNMSGRRLLPRNGSMSWPALLRHSSDPTRQNTYTLLDAAALAMTFPMGEVFRAGGQGQGAGNDGAPDFTVLSLYKIFGFPDLGCVVVRKESGHILALRRYFGGGTVKMVTALTRKAGRKMGWGRGQQRDWHVSKALSSSSQGGGEYELHDGLEDGTLPFHSILALGEAIDAFERLYGDMGVVARHAGFLVGRLYRGMVGMRHWNGRRAVRVYGGEGGGDDQVEEERNKVRFEDSRLQGSTVAFNLVNEDGSYVPYSDVEKAANEAGIYIRSGGVCNPGGIFSALGYEPWMTERALSAGHHCGSDGISIINRLPTGIVRASLGAMSTKSEVDTFLHFLYATFVSKAPSPERATVITPSPSDTSTATGYCYYPRSHQPSSSSFFDTTTTGGEERVSSSSSPAYTLSSSKEPPMVTADIHGRAAGSATAATAAVVPYRFVVSPDGLAPACIGTPLKSVVGGV